MRPLHGGDARLCGAGACGLVGAVAMRTERMDSAAFEVLEPYGPPAPVLVSAPHSGTLLPAEVAATLVADGATVAALDDGPVHRLFADAPALGVTVLVARFRRVCADLNRDPCEMAPDAVEGLPVGLRPRVTARARVGLGVIPTRAGPAALVRTPLSTAAFVHRLARYWEPYHRELQRRLRRLAERFGTVLLLDVHSMPTSAAGEGGRLVDVCIGDRFARSAHPALSRAAFDHFARHGLRVARNSPFAGGFITRHYGRPERGIHALQLEFRRALFLDETRLEPHAGTGALAATCRGLLERLLAERERLAVAPAA